ncbi:MAG: UbiA family prenyltransferase [Candidatus Pacebacteria bacterium]|nr:UbiA family prenyltransferase [Candidatus Paceibacterota bacterium]
MTNYKKYKKIVWDNLVYGGHILSLGSIGIIIATSLLLNIKITWDILVLVYTGMHAAYLYNRYKDFENDASTNNNRTNYFKKFINQIPIIILSLIIFDIFILLVFSNFKVLIIALGLLVMSFLYSKFFKRITRILTGFKSFFVSVMWASLVPFSVIYYSNHLGLSTLFLFTFTLLRWVVNTSFFDIKDINSDKKEGLKTLASILGEKKLLILLNCISLLTAPLMLLGIYLKALPLISLSLLFTIPYNFYFIKKLSDKSFNKDILYNVVVDGEFILWPIFIAIVKLI